MIPAGDLDRLDDHSGVLLCVSPERRLERVASELDRPARDHPILGGDFSVDREHRGPVADEGRCPADHHAFELLVALTRLEERRDLRVALQVDDLLRLGERAEDDPPVSNYVPHRGEMWVAVRVDRCDLERATGLEETGQLVFGERDVSAGHAANLPRAVCLRGSSPAAYPGVVPYSTVLFDLDHTLLDSDASEAAAFDHAMRFAGVAEPAELFDTYRRINLAMWARVEAGTLSAEEVRVLRFEEFNRVSHIDTDAHADADADGYSHKYTNSNQHHDPDRHTDGNTTASLCFWQRLG